MKHFIPILRNLLFGNKVGRYLSMQDHVAKALTLKHPVDSVVALDQDQLDAIRFCMERSDDELINHRKLQLLKIKILAKRLEPQETELHSPFELGLKKWSGARSCCCGRSSWSKCRTTTCK